MVQDEIQRVQKEEKQTEKRIKNIIFNNINLTRCHEKENDYYIFKYKHIATIFFMFNYTRNYNRR